MSAAPEHVEADPFVIPTRKYNAALADICELQLRNGVSFLVKATPDGRITLAAATDGGYFEPASCALELATALVRLALSSERDE